MPYSQIILYREPLIYTATSSSASLQTRYNSSGLREDGDLHGKMYCDSILYTRTPPVRVDLILTLKTWSPMPDAYRIIVS